MPQNYFGLKGNDIASVVIGKTRNECSLIIINRIICNNYYLETLLFVAKEHILASFFFYASSFYC